MRAGTMRGTRVGCRSILSAGQQLKEYHMVVTELAHRILQADRPSWFKFCSTSRPA